jgi:hypothetical protein
MFNKCHFALTPLLSSGLGEWSPTSVHHIVGAQFACPLKTSFKRASLVVFPSIHPTIVASSRTTSDRQSPCVHVRPCGHRNVEARETAHA